MPSEVTLPVRLLSYAMEEKSGLLWGVIKQTQNPSPKLFPRVTMHVAPPHQMLFRYPCHELIVLG